MIALSIMHGGPGPQCLSHAVVDYIFHGMCKVKASVDDVPDIVVQRKLKQVCKLLQIFTRYFIIYCY